MNSVKWKSASRKTGLQQCPPPGPHRHHYTEKTTNYSTNVLDSVAEGDTPTGQAGTQGQGRMWARWWAQS